MLYSDKSIQKLAQNDSTKYDRKANVRRDYQDTCNRSVYLLNDKYRFKKYLEYNDDWALICFNENNYKFEIILTFKV